MRRFYIRSGLTYLQLTYPHEGRLDTLTDAPCRRMKFKVLLA